MSRHLGNCEPRQTTWFSIPLGWGSQEGRFGEVGNTAGEWSVCDIRDVACHIRTLSVIPEFPGRVLIKQDAHKGTYCVLLGKSLLIR